MDKDSFPQCLMLWPVLKMFVLFQRIIKDKFSAFWSALFHISTKAVDALIGLIFLAFGFKFMEHIVSSLNILHCKPYHLLSFIYSEPHINFSIAAGTAGGTRH